MGVVHRQSLQASITQGLEGSGIAKKRSKNIMKAFFLLVITFCSIDVSMLQPMQRITPMVLFTNDSLSECPTVEKRQEVRQLLQSAVRETIQTSYGVYIPECGPGRWRRAFYVNASEDESCPGDWSVQTTPVTGCAGVSSQCSSAFSGDVSSEYNRVCGRIIGEGVSSPDGFLRGPQNRNIENNYLDGVSITHGASGSRTHIWTFAAGHSATNFGWVARCPCDNPNRAQAPLPPSEVGDNYFCDRADQLDRLWTGESCASENPCCSFHDPPYFSRQLPAATTNRIELRLCHDQNQGDENVLVLFAEIYVQ